MDYSFVIIILIVLLTVLLAATLFILFVYSGLFTDIKVSAGTPPIENVTILYKYGRGSYKNTGPIFTEVTSIAPKKKSVGVYYDDPDQVSTDELRWAVGVIVAEGSVVPDDTLVTKFKKEGFTEFTFPSIQNVVKATFPCPTQISVLLGIYMVYPKLGEYVKERRLCAHPWIEIYDGENIHYMAPLSKQDQFYVPEACQVTEKKPGTTGRQVNRSQEGNNDAVEDRQRKPLTVRPFEGSRCSVSEDNVVTNSIKLLEVSSTVTEALPLRSQSVHVVYNEKRANGDVRSASVDTATQKDRGPNSTPVRLSLLDSLTDQSHVDGEDSFELESSMCSSSSIAESDISTASSYYSSEYSCSSMNTLHDSSLNSDIGKSDSEHTDGTKLCKEL